MKYIVYLIVLFAALALAGDSVIVCSASDEAAPAGAQEAHEAIRPTSAMRDPEKVKDFLDPAMFKLYRLIWQRFVASQMESAVYDTLQVEVTGKTSEHEYLLRAS